MNVEPFDLPLSSPLATADGEIDRRRGFLVRCEHRGHWGVGEATPLPGWTESHGDCERALADAGERTRDGDVTAARRSLPATATAARHGVSTALLDADARADDVPLCTWFDADRSPGAVPVNATIGDGTPEETATVATGAVASGFDCLKVKIGARSTEADLDRLEAIRDAVGDGPTLRVDANAAWSRETATDILPALADLGVAVVEQPLDPDDLDGHVDLRGGPVEIALDESLVERSVAAVLDADAADALVLKPMVLGGPGEAYAIARRCRRAEIDPIVSTTVDAIVARTAAIHVAAAIPDVRPCGLATADRLAADLGPDPATIESGRIEVPDGTGLGLAEVGVDG